MDINDEKDSLSKLGENNGFRTICLDCGSTNVVIESDGDYVYDGENEYWREDGFFLLCKECGQTGEEY